MTIDELYQALLAHSRTDESQAFDEVVYVALRYDPFWELMTLH